MPNNPIFCVPVAALSMRISCADNAPDEGGEKLTAIVHDAPPAKVLVQVVLPPSTANAEVLVVMLLILIVPPGALVLGLVTVTNLSGLVVPCGTVPNETDVGLNVGAASVPVPFSVIVAGLFLALLVMIKPPVSAPCMLGVKDTVTVQLLFAGSTPVHPSVTTAKSPEVATLLIVIPTEFGFVTVAVLVALVAPTWVLANTRLPERVIDACRPVPLRLTVCGLFGPLEGIVAVPV